LYSRIIGVQSTLRGIAQAQSVWYAVWHFSTGDHVAEHSKEVLAITRFAELVSAGGVRLEPAGKQLIIALAHGVLYWREACDIAVATAARDVYEQIQANDAANHTKEV
jgi:hypothetical protein